MSSTLKYLINVHARFQKIDYFTTLHAFIRSCTFYGYLERCRPALLLHPAHFDAFFEGLSFPNFVSKQLQCSLTYVICALQYFVLYNNMYQTSILSINNSFSKLELVLHSLITDYTPCTFITYPLTLHILK